MLALALGLFAAQETDLEENCDVPLGMCFWVVFGGRKGVKQPNLLYSVPEFNANLRFILGSIGRYNCWEQLQLGAFQSPGAPQIVLEKTELGNSCLVPVALESSTSRTSRGICLTFLCRTIQGNK